MAQPDALLSFLRALHKGDELPILPKGIIVFTGFEIEELQGAQLECLQYIDLLIDGRYVEELRYTSGLAGSSNQRFHFSKKPGRGEARVPRDQIEIDQEVEIHAGEGSVVEVTGFPAVDKDHFKKLGLRVLK